MKMSIEKHTLSHPQGCFFFFEVGGEGRFISIIFVFPIMTMFKTEMLKLTSRPTKKISFVQRPGLLYMPNESGLAAKFWCTYLNTF